MLEGEVIDLSGEPDEATTLRRALAAKVVGTVQVGSVVLVSGSYPGEELQAIAMELRRVLGHSKFLVVALPEGDVKVLDREARDSLRRALDAMEHAATT